MSEGKRDEIFLANIVANRCETDPDFVVATFVEVGLGGELIEEARTYAELWAGGQRIAQLLQARGIGAGDAFGLMMQNHPVFIEAMIASSLTGAIYVPIDPRIRHDKLRYMLEFTRCRGVLCADYCAQAVGEVRCSLPAGFWTIALETGATHIPSELSLQQAIERETRSGERVPMTSVDPDAPMQMMFTSGTTGDPKAILSAHRRFGDYAAMGARFGLHPGDRPYTGLSLTHSNAQMTTLSFALGMKLGAVFSRKFTKSRIWDICRAYGCTSFNLLGGMSTSIYAEPERPDDADNPVRFVLSAGMPIGIWDRFEQRFGLKIFEWYGQSEGVATLNPPGHGPKGSIGKPPPHLEATLFDESGAECTPGQAGELAFRRGDGSRLPLAYFRNEAASAAKFRDGWMLTGDIAHRDEEGWLFFHGRAGGIIRRNGDFINPGFVEGSIAEHADVVDVFVYGVPAASGAPGESDIVAAIVARNVATFDAEALGEHCRARLEPNFVPSVFQLVDEIPKTASEKPQERFLKLLLDDPGVSRAGSAGGRCSGFLDRAGGG